MLDGLRLRLLRRLATLTGQDPQVPALQHDPIYVEALRTQGNALIAEERFEEAEQCFRKALENNADDTKLLVCLGYVLKEQARYSEARIALRRAALLGNADPEGHEALYVLAEISELQADTEDAIRQLTKALSLKPDFTRACADLVRLLEQSNQELAVRALLVRSVNLCPDCIDYRLWLAKSCTAAHDYQATFDALAAVVSLGGANGQVHLAMGVALCRLERYEDSQLHFHRAVEMDQSLVYQVRHHQGYAQSALGNSEEAIALLEESIELQPDFLNSHHLLLLELSFAQSQIRGRYRDAALRFNQAARPLQKLAGSIAHPSLDATERLLRVGFVCGEFKNHPVYYFLIGILAHIDRSQFQLLAYSNNLVDDHLTQSFKDEMDEWRDIQRMSDDAAAELIRSDKIDVLIDLNGHLGQTRLPVFARKPAPVQAAWLGYFASTGLSEMDFIIADPTSVPEDSTEWFSEQVVRMPATRLCMVRPKPTRNISVSPPPAVKNGYITFGSFQQAAKINHKVMQAWSLILAQTPNSRLRIQSITLGSETVREALSIRMRAAGIDLQRVDMHGVMPWEDYLEAHNEVDMLIDTFPFTGGTTTATALWMGVPIVSILGDTMLSRQGATMLNCVGLSNWIACDVADYVYKAVKFSADMAYLVHLRASLRALAEKSPLFDNESFAKHFQSTVMRMHTQHSANLNEASTST